MKHLVILAVFSLAFYGCSTSYHAMGSSDTGYTDGVMPSGSYFVTFTGDKHTSKETVKKYTLRRCAEITIANGSLYFEILRDFTSMAEERTPVTNYKTGGTYTYTDEAYTGSLEIKLLPKAPPKIIHPFYDAKAILGI